MFNLEKYKQWIKIPAWFRSEDRDLDDTEDASFDEAVDLSASFDERSGWYELCYKRLKEGACIVLATLAVFLLLALLTHDTGDPGWSYMGHDENIVNAAGKIGAWVSDVLFSLLGLIAFGLPFCVAYTAKRWYQPALTTKTQTPAVFLVVRSLGLGVAIASACALATTYDPGWFYFPMGAGGILGQWIHSGMVSQFNIMGSTLLLLSFILVGMTLYTGVSWFQLMHRFLKALQSKACQQLTKGWEKCRLHWKKRRQGANVKRRMSMPVPDEKISLIPAVPSRSTTDVPSLAAPDAREEGTVEKTAALVKSWLPLKKTSQGQGQGEILPPLALLEGEHQAAVEMYSDEALKNLSELVETRLKEFNINVDVVACHPGPVITRFELELAPGVKVSRISSLVKDLARSLSVMSVRVVEVIPGRSTVGLEIPNMNREVVALHGVLNDEVYQSATSALTLALGKDISGHAVVVDLSKMPHLLVAGTTGAGKSVGLNAMLLSILYKAKPSDVRMILIDPKMLELAIYDDIPHLLTPVVTDMKDAANALRWCVAEMERRYQLMAALGVRNLAGYNRKIQMAAQDGKAIADPIWQGLEESERPALEQLPSIVVVVDEFADLMMVVGKKVEELIARIAQKARAAGIHLILATQRPSVDVITGLIKANIPTRIAFQVSSRVDSRTILDQMGAEQLLGHGDMLYLPPGTAIPTRIHGAFVSDEQVHRVVESLKSNGPPQYVESVVNSVALSIGGQSGQEEDTDELYDEAIFIVTDSRRPSISHLQRRLKIGYNRAARMIEKMEEDGVISPVQANGTREVIAPPPPAPTEGE